MRLIKFEVIKQIKSWYFIFFTALIVIFVLSQLSAPFFLPAKSEKGISILENMGEQDYLWVDSTEQDLENSAIEFFGSMEDSVDEDTSHEFHELVNMIQNQGKTFDEASSIILEEYPDLSGWVNSFSQQYSQKLGTPEEVNANLAEDTANKTYNAVYSEEFVTYTQVVVSFLLIIVCLMVFTRDSKYDMVEIVNTCPYKPGRYLISKYLSCVLPTCGLVFIAGLFMNTLICIKFLLYGITFNFFVYFLYYFVIFLPTILFLSALIMFLFLLFKNAVAAFAVYILYAIFNVMQQVFMPSLFNMNNLLVCIIRFDSTMPYDNFIIYNRALYIFLTVVLIAVSLKIYKKSQFSLEKVVKL